MPKTIILILMLIPTILQASIDDFNNLSDSEQTSLSSVYGNYTAEAGHMATISNKLRINGGTDKTITLDLSEALKSEALHTIEVNIERWTSANPFTLIIEAKQAGSWTQIQDASSAPVGSAGKDFSISLSSENYEAFRFTCTSPSGKGALLDDITLTYGDQTLITEVIQQEVPIIINQDNSKILHFKINNIAAQDGETLNTININTNGTTDLSDIASLSLFYTGTDGSFSNNPDDLVATTSTITANIALPLSFNFTQGTHNFWLACTFSETASLLNSIDAGIDSIELAQGGTIAIENGNPAVVKKPAYDVISGGTVLKYNETTDKVCTGIRIPGMATTNRGTLLAVYDLRWNSYGDLPGDIDVAVSRSTDQGDSWSAPLKMMDLDSWGGLPEGSNGIGDPAILVDRTDNTVYVAAVWSHGSNAWGSSGPGLEPAETGQFMITKSHDDGQTWSELVNITKQIKDPDWTYLLQGPGKGITLRNGTIVFPAQYQEAVTRRPRSTLIYSTDKGETWSIGTGIPYPSYTTEAQVVELENGDIMLNARISNASRAIYTTSDLGQTWTEHATSGNDVLPMIRGCMASLIRHSWETEGWDTNRLVYSAPNDIGYSRRSHMSIRVSENDGDSWTAPYIIDEIKGAYSCMTMIDNRHIGIIYEGSQSDMTFQKFPISTFLGEDVTPPDYDFHIYGGTRQGSLDGGILNDFVNNPRGLNLTYTKKSGPDLITVNNDGSYTTHIDSDNLGVSQFVIEVADENGHTDEFTLEIELVNHTVTFDLGQHGTSTDPLTISVLTGDDVENTPQVNTSESTIFLGWDTALDNITTDTTITAIYKTADSNGSLVHYNFDDMSNGTVEDISGSELNAQLINLDSSGASVNGAVDFSDGDGYIKTPSIAGQFRTIAFRYKSDRQLTGDDTPNEPVMNFGDGVRNGFIWSGASTSGTSGETLTIGSNGTTSLTNTIDDQWHHYTYVWNGTTYDVYKDGELQVSTLANSGCSLISSQVIELGARTNDSRFCNDSIDDFIILNRSITAAEITKLINNEALDTLPIIDLSVNGELFYTSDTITLNAQVNYGAPATSLSFFSGETLIGEDTDGTDGWSFNWTNAPAGVHDLRVVANGVSAEAQSQQIIQITVLGHNQALTINEGGYPHFRIPAIITTQAGSVLLFAEGRQIKDDHARNDIAIKRSDDNGQTWTGFNAIHADQDLVMTNPSPVLLDSGRILLFYQTFPHGLHARDGNDYDMLDDGYEDGRTQKFFMRISDDDGLTWSEPTDLTTTAREATGIIAFGSPANGIQLQKGSHQGRIVVPSFAVERLSATQRQFKNCVLYSDDQGQTWQRGGYVPIVDTVPGDECLVAELDNGDLMMNSRNSTTTRTVTVSRDGGETWQPFNYDDELTGRACNAGLFRYSFADEDRSRLLFSNNNHLTQRSNGTLRISYNNGQTWTRSKVIVPGEFGYSQITRLANGNIGIVYEPFQGTDVDWNINFMSIPLSWIEGSQASVDSDGDNINDDEDAFPDDINEWQDSDFDGTGDNADDFDFDPNEQTDSDNDGVGDNSDAFPNDPNKWELILLPGTLAYYDFRDFNNNTAQDLSENNYDAQLVSLDSLTTSVNGAADFSSGDGYIRTPVISGDFQTIAFRFKSNRPLIGDDDNSEPIMNFGDGTQVGFIWSGSATSNISGETITFGSSGTTATTTAIDDQWHHIAYVWNGNAYDIYLDGDIQTPARSDANGADLISSEALEIGARSNTSSYCNDAVDDLMIFDRALGLFEIKDLANGTSAEDGEIILMNMPETTTISLDDTINLLADVRESAPATAVSFYANDILLGQDTDGTDGWSFSWTVTEEGNHLVHAVAEGVDDDKKTSNTVSITAFVQNQIYINTVDGYPNFRIPAIVTSNTGTALAFAEGRTHNHDHARNDMVLKRSLDNGQTWGDLITIHADTELVMTNPSPVVLDDGRILLFYQTFPHGYHSRSGSGYDFLDEGYNEGTTQRFLMRTSNDDGLTWSDATDLTTTLRPATEIVSCGSPANAIVIQKGPYAGRIVVPSNNVIKKADGSKDKISSIFYSDDNAATWNQGGYIPFGGTDPSGEVIVAELDNGDLMMNGRTPHDYRAVAISRDGGTTWEDYAYDYDLYGSPCNSALFRYSYSDESKNRLLFSNNANNSNRTTGTLRLSYDDGETWAKNKLIVPGTFGYSQMTKLSNGSIGIVYEPSVGNIGFISVPMAWLEDDSDGDGYSDDNDRFPQDPSEWQDSDDDGYGDNADRFPQDPNEWQDSDDDGHGDNADRFPQDPSEWQDSDNDGYGDNADRFPQDPTEWQDSDDDGLGDNSDPTPDGEEPLVTKPRFRLYNPNDGNHHWTTMEAEYQALIEQGWTGEGYDHRISLTEFTLEDVTSLPLYRLYNPNSGEHHWTMSVDEYNTVGDAGWIKENTDGFTLMSQAGDAISLFRLYNPNSGLHHYTTNAAEQQTLINSGWIDEGISAWVFPVSTIPIFSGSSTAF